MDPLGTKTPAEENDELRARLSSKYGDEIAEGDVIVFLDQSHRVDEIEVERSTGTPGFVRRTARSRDGWSIALEPLVRYEIGG